MVVVGHIAGVVHVVGALADLVAYVGYVDVLAVDVVVGYVVVFAVERVVVHVAVVLVVGAEHVVVLCGAKVYEFFLYTFRKLITIFFVVFEFHCFVESNAITRKIKFYHRAIQTVLE